MITLKTINKCPTYITFSPDSSLVYFPHGDVLNSENHCGNN